MTTTIPHRELRNDSARILARAAAGESFLITNRGEVVARLVPPGPEDDPVAEAIRAGLATPATRSLADLPEPRRLRGVTSRDILDDIRGQW